MSLQRLGLFLLVASSVRAAEPVFDAHVFADFYYAYNVNRPADGASFFAGTGTSAKQANDVSLNLAAVDLALRLDPVALRLILHAGNGAEVVHSGEPAGDATGPDVWRHVQQASVAWTPQGAGGLAFELGIMPCFIGLEAIASKDNWHYTRGWMAELSPYYQAGIKVSYPFTSSLSAQLHVMNGWQIVGENNEMKSFGAQLAYTTDALTVVVNGYAGPELAGDDDHWRLFQDTYAVLKPTDWLSIAATVDVGWQDRPDGGALWYAAGGHVRVQVAPRVALAGRGEWFDDSDGGISGTSQQLAEGTLTLEVTPATGLIVKLEGRYDRSTAPVFTDHDGAGTKDQTLIVLGVAGSL